MHKRMGAPGEHYQRAPGGAGAEENERATERQLRFFEDVQISLEKPLYPRDGDQFPLNADVLAVITVPTKDQHAPPKTFMLINEGGTAPGDRRLSIIDETHFQEPLYMQGRAPIPEGQQTIIGRNFLTTTFDYPATVSRQHFAVIAAPEGVSILDMGAANGTFLTANGLTIGELANQTTAVDRLMPRTTPRESTIVDDEESSISLSHLGEKDANEVFNRVKIRGDEGDLQGVGTITPEHIAQAGLKPRHLIETTYPNADGKEQSFSMWVSSGFDIGHGRTAVIGYVRETNGDIVARSYYYSNSSGVLRYLPAYGTLNGYTDYFDKGHDEESITMPAAIQEGVSRSIEADGGIITPDPQLANAIFIGTSRHQLSDSERTGYYDRVNTYPLYVKLENQEQYVDRLLPRRIEDEDGERLLQLPRPDFVVPIASEMPNFAERRHSWQRNTTHYGRATFESYPSEDGNLLYTFCRYANGVHISSIERADSPLEETGLRVIWIDGGGLTVPGFEYWQQASGYGNPDNRIGSYVDMTTNYTSQLEPVKRYLAHLSERS